MLLRYIINRSFCSKEIMYSEMVCYYIGVDLVNRTLDGRLEIKNFSFRVIKYFNTRRVISYLLAAI